MAKCALSLCWLCPHAYLSTNPYSYSRPLPRPNKALWRKNGLIPKSESLDKTPRWFSEGSEGNIWKLKMEDRHKNRIQDNLSFLVKVWRILKLSKKWSNRAFIEQDTDYDRLRPELLKHKLFPATHLARIEERPNKKLELYLQVPFDPTFNKTNKDIY